MLLTETVNPLCSLCVNNEEISVRRVAKRRVSVILAEKGTSTCPIAVVSWTRGWSTIHDQVAEHDHTPCGCAIARTSAMMPV